MPRHILIFMVLMLSVPSAQAKLFDNPEIVSYLHAEVVKEGSVTLVATGSGAKATSLEIRNTMPQNTESQSVSLISASGIQGHRFEQDENGNRIIVLRWDNPPIGSSINYTLVFDVEVTDSQDSAPQASFATTPLTEPSAAITQEAYEVSSGLGPMDKFMALTSYVNGIVEYDKSYQNVQKSAQWVFENRKAVCDGHANLLISMLRSLGYDAYYAIGYAYTEDDLDPQDPVYWGPHGWVEVKYQGKAISLDPTWDEHPVDATHIKLAISPDSNYTEYVQTMASNTRVEWDKGDYRVRMLDSHSRPRIAIQGRLVPQVAGSDEHSLFIADVSSNMDEPCVLSSVRLQSCTENGVPFLDISPGDRGISLCGNETLYWLIGVPPISLGVEYTCPVTAYGGGASETIELRAVRASDSTEAELSTRKVLSQGEGFTVTSTIRNTGLGSQELEAYLMIGDYVQSYRQDIGPMQEAEVIWTTRAPGRPGTYPLRLFLSSGRMAEEEITVVESRSVRIASASIPDEVSESGKALINITLEGLNSTSGLLTVMVGDRQLSEAFSLAKGQSSQYSLEYYPDSEGRKYINIVVVSDGEKYEAGMTGSMLVVGETGWLDGIINAIVGFLESVFEMLGIR